MKQPHGTTSVMISTTLLSCFFKFIAVLLHPRWCDATCFQCDRARRPTDRTRNIHLFLYFFPVTGRQISTMKCWSKGTVFVLLLSWRRGGVGGGEKRRRRGGEGMKRKNGLTEEMARLSLRWGSFWLRSSSANMFLIYRPACFALWSPFHALFGCIKVII